MDVLEGTLWLIRCSQSEEYKINVVDNPCRGHTLTEPSYFHLLPAVYWFPQFVRQSLVCLQAGRLSLSGAQAGVSKASCEIGEIASREEGHEMGL